jgi:hypothetical protein
VGGHDGGMARRITIAPLIVLAVLLASAAPGWAAPIAAQEEVAGPTGDIPAVEGEAAPAEVEEPSDLERPTPAEQPTSPTSDEIPPPPQYPPMDTTGPWWQWSGAQDSIAAQFFGGFVYQEFWTKRVGTLASPGQFSQLIIADVMADDPLRDELNFMRMLDARGQAQVVVVEHRPIVTYADQEQFVIIDSYIDRSYLVDARSRTPIGAGPDVEPEVNNMAYLIRRTFDEQRPGFGFWKVVDSVKINFVDRP